MGKNRLEAFSDGVIAIIITIMVLELKVPHSPDFRALLPLWPVFMSYVLSFVYVGIYWNNHHHTLQAVEEIGGGVLWANLHLLFWLSLIPFVTAWMGENHFETGPTVAYGLVLFTARMRRWPRPSATIARGTCRSCCTWPASRCPGSRPGWASWPMSASPSCGWFRTGASRKKWPRTPRKYARAVTRLLHIRCDDAAISLL
jgi:hypothetical protein